MDLKILALLFVVLMSITPAYAAQDNTSLSKQDIGANMVYAGIELVVRSLADACNMLWQMPENGINNNFDNKSIKDFDQKANITANYGVTRSSIMTFVSINIQPDKIEAVQHTEERTTPIWLLLVIIYILGNPIRNILARMGYNTYNDIFGTPNLSGEKYIGTVILLIFSYATPNLVLLGNQACTMASQYFMLNIMDYIEPNLDNAWLYLFMAIGEAFLSIFFIIRPFVICIIYSICKLLAVWFLFGIWRGEITWIWSRYFKILTLQPVVILVTCICIIGLQWSHMDAVTGAYIAMFALLFYICYKWMTGNFDIPGRLVRMAAGSAI
jgi:hypothetical protein